MAQVLQSPTQRDGLSGVDEEVLKLLESRPLSVEQVVVALTNVNQSEVLSSISRLIDDGYVELAILQYPWGVEFELQTIRHTIG
jgi:hypothetical protein